MGKDFSGHTHKKENVLINNEHRKKVLRFSHQRYRNHNNNAIYTIESIN